MDGRLDAEGRRWSAQLDDALLTVDAPCDLAVRVTYAPAHELAPRRPWNPVPGPSGAVRVTGTGARAATIEAAGLQVLVDDLGRIQVRRADGSVIADDGPAGGPRHDGEIVRWRRTMPAGSTYAGFGARTGTLDRRGTLATCWSTDPFRDQGPRTDALHVAVPFRIEVASDGTCSGVLLDTTWRSWIDLRAIDTGVEELGTCGPELAVVVLAGPTPADVLEQLTRLTGRQALPPRWALGYHQTRWGYEDQGVIAAVAAAARDRRIPCDVVGLDLDHMDRARSFTWSPTAFPDPEALHERLAAMHVHTTAIVDVGIAVGSDVERDGRARGFLVSHADGTPVEGFVWPGRSVLPDVTRPDVRRWWASGLPVLVDAGVGGFVVDMNEPSLRDRPIDDPGAELLEVPPDAIHGSPAQGPPATHAEVHNAYGTLTAQAVAEELAVLAPDRRPFVLTRAGGTGVQRHAGVWAGDHASVWDHLRLSLIQVVELGLSGIALAGADVGGFHADCDDELLVRWFQLGAVLPLMRNNSARGTVAQEPWSRGELVEAACRSAVELRSRLVPLVASLLDDAARTGTPVLRPLWWHDPADEACRRLDDHAMLGDDLLVAPVLAPGARARAVRLPRGRWYDAHRGTAHDGPSWHLVQAPLEGPLPLFVRAGAIVPLGPVRQWVDEPVDEPLTLLVAPGPDGAADGRLVEDDGTSPAGPGDGWRTTAWAWADDGSTTATTVDRDGRPVDGPAVSWRVLG